MIMSDRIKSFQASPIRRLTPYALDAEKNGVRVLHLNIGQPDIATPVEALDEIKRFNDKIIAYGQSDGLFELKEALCKYYAGYGVSIEPKNIIITTGGSEALQFAFMTLCDPGCQVIVPEPYYTNVESFARIAGVELVPVTSHLDDNFALPLLSNLEEKITPKTRAILINSPNNPTGYVYTPDELETLLEMCERHDIFLIADEVYREFCYDGRQYIPVMKFEKYIDRIVCVDSFSKRFSMCGARVGALVSRNAQFICEVNKLAQARLCPPVIEQKACLKAFTAPESYIKNVKAEYEKRRNCIVEGLRSIPGVKCSMPHGAFYLIAELPVDDAEKFCIFMLKDFRKDGKTVMLAPAEGFYVNHKLGRHQVRIAYVLNCEDLKDAVECIREGLKAYQAIN